MRTDHRPYLVKRAQAELERWYTEHFIAPQLDALGSHPMIMKPWHFKPHGAGISIGQGAHIVTSSDRKVRLTTWSHAGGQGAIEIGDHVLLCPGSRIDSASRVTVGTGTMFASNVYVTDADWHDLYDRAQPIGKTQPVVLEQNVWLGDSSIVCKGVTIGENSVIGAGSVVVKDIPANVIAAGNPATVVRELDMSVEMRTRADEMANLEAVAQQTRDIERYVLTSNGWWPWLRSILAPRRGE